MLNSTQDQIKLKLKFELSLAIVDYFSHKGRCKKTEGGGGKRELFETS